MGLRDGPGGGLSFSPSDVVGIDSVEEGYRRPIPAPLCLSSREESYVSDGTLSRIVGISDTDTVIPLGGVGRADSEA